MDKNTDSLITLQDSTADLSGYTLYPDAGDFAGLDKPLPLSEPTPAQPEVSRTAVPHAPVPPLFPRTPPDPEALHPLSPPAAHRPRRLFRLLCGFFVFSALAVYGDLLLTGGASLLAEGADRLSLKNVFGTGNTITVLPLPEETVQLPEPAASPPETFLPDTAPPASELPVPVPAAGILARDLSSDAPDGLGLINETPYTPDLAALAARDPVIDSYGALESVYGQGCPAVLILHTHGTEAFADLADAGYHTEQKDRNICAVGEALAATLTEAGIGVIHCTELFDAESFDMAYYNAARYIRGILEEYPSIRYILDIHRDAITTGDGTGIRPLSAQEDMEYAQLMFVVGTDHGGSGHTDWETNLSLAARLQCGLHEKNPTLMRDINLRSASFNAQYAPGALLVEAGAAASTLEEAVRSIEILGEALAKEIHRK